MRKVLEPLRAGADATVKVRFGHLTSGFILRYLPKPDGYDMPNAAELLRARRQCEGGVGNESDMAYTFVTCSLSTLALFHLFVQGTDGKPAADLTIDEELKAMLADPRLAEDYQKDER